MSSDTQKRILLIDAVLWTDDFPTQDRLRDVSRWFHPHFERSPLAQVTTVSAEADLDSFPGSELDGVVISGSPRDAWGDDPVNARLCRLILRCHDHGIPVLGVCYGHQIVGRALGAEVGRNPLGWELGNIPITLTASGVSSALFHGFPPVFPALQSHADAVLKLPASCQCLALGEQTAVQSFSCDNLLFGVQFHPETTPEILRYLWEPRRDEWRRKIGFDLDGRLDSLAPAPIAARVLDNFINHIVS